MIRVELLRAWPRRHVSESLDLPDGSSVGDALAATTLDLAGISGYAVHGERVDEAALLRDGDRLELLSPLRVDPKDARRRRAGKRAATGR